MSVQKTPAIPAPKQHCHYDVYAIPVMWTASGEVLMSSQKVVLSSADGRAGGCTKANSSEPNMRPPPPRAAQRCTALYKGCMPNGRWFEAAGRPAERFLRRCLGATRTSHRTSRELLRTSLSLSRTSCGAVASLRRSQREPQTLLRTSCES